MPQDFSEVLTRLYKPPRDGVRQVLALSRRDAGRLPRLSSIAIISITGPERPPANLDGFNHILRLRFEDVDFLSPSISIKAKNKLTHAFTLKQARAIRSFVGALPDSVDSVVVHCEGGHSRSCAVALALHRLYGYHAETEHFIQANSSVVQLMMKD